ncbi:lipid A biosynthesis lauroyl acyltransferase [Candidatus Endowatersipora endosymbiont of Watersipora subatra]|uniref:lipid A biosynthesis lauroyl acyltransferase n=1 Tax=Candidatus Endowatersipora endosymbiont of Watersipora subatra TaxID=3077946 RepID=UPI00312C6E0E
MVTSLSNLKTAYNWIVSALVSILLRIAKKLPPDQSTAIAESSGKLLSPFLPRSKLARKNLRLAFPHYKQQEINEIVRCVWGNVARTLTEYVFLDDLFNYDLEKQGEGRIDINGAENFRKILESDKPSIIFTAHTGNWEILPIAAANYGLDITVLFRPPNNRFLAQRLLKARHMKYCRFVPSCRGVAAALTLSRVLNSGGIVGLLADQAFAKGPRIQFLGRQASANPLAAKLALRHHCDIYPSRCIRLPGGRFRIELNDAINIPDHQDQKNKVVEITLRINEIIESWVKEYPDQWLWLHDRWKLKEILPPL